MLVIGLTGGIGSGKSTVANLFAKYGIPIIDADVIAREVTSPNEPVFKKIISHFSDHFLIKDGVLDRSKLRDIIFKLPEERKWLENLLHPAILERIERQIALISAPYCIIVIPLLFETGPHSFINRILVIDASEQTQIDRVVTRDQSNQFQIEGILNTQASREQRLQGADDVIVNDGSLEDLTHQVEKLHKLYSKLSAQ